MVHFTPSSIALYKILLIMHDYLYLPFIIGFVVHMPGMVFNSDDVTIPITPGKLETLLITRASPWGRPSSRVRPLRVDIIDYC